MFTSLIERFAKLIKNNPYNYQMVSIFASIVTLATLIAGCEAIKGTSTPILPPTGEPGMTDEITPRPSPTKSETPTNTASLAPSPTPTQTIEPTAEPYNSMFGISEFESGTIVSMETQAGFNVLDINGIFKVVPTANSIIRDVEGGQVEDIIALYKNKKIITMSMDGTTILDISQDYFSNIFPGERLQIRNVGSFDFKSLMEFFKKAGYQIDEKFFMSISTGDHTLRELEEWYVKALPKIHQLSKTDYMLYHRVSDIPQINDDKKIEYRENGESWSLYLDDKIIHARRVELSNGTIKYLYYIAIDGPILVDIFSGEYIYINGKPNMEFFKKYMNIESFDEIKSIEKTSIQETVSRPYIKKDILMSAYGPMMNAKTVRDIREAIEMMPESCWYVPSKYPVDLNADVNMIYTYKEGHLKTAEEIIANKNLTNSLKNSEYYNTLRKTFKF